MAASAVALRILVRTLARVQGVEAAHRIAGPTAAWAQEAEAGNRAVASLAAVSLVDQTLEALEPLVREVEAATSVRQPAH